MDFVLNEAGTIRSVGTIRPIFTRAMSTGVDIGTLAHMGAEFVAAVGLFIWTNKKVSTVSKTISEVDDKLTARIKRLEDQMRVQSRIIMEMDRIISGDREVGGRIRPSMSANPSRSSPSPAGNPAESPLAGSRSNNPTSHWSGSRPSTGSPTPTPPRSTPPPTSGARHSTAKSPKIEVEEKGDEPDTSVLDDILFNELNALVNSRANGTQQSPDRTGNVTDPAGGAPHYPSTGATKGDGDSFGEVELVFEETEGEDKKKVRQDTRDL